MSRLKELIEELCPNGVEFKKLGELGIFYGGLTGKSKDDFREGNAKYITYMNVYKNIKVDIQILETVKVKENEKQNRVMYGDILFTGSSENMEECGLSSVYTEKNEEAVYLNSFSFGFRFNDKRIFEPEFTKYLFRSNDLRKQIIRSASGVTRFNVSKRKMENVVVPVPPLEVQREIVHILDDFTLLSAELSAELKARKQQYEYYRDKLLNDDNNNKFIKLGEITDLITKGTTPSSFTNTGINFIKTESFNNGIIDKNKLKYIDKETHEGKLKRSILKENDLLFTIAGATIGKMAVVTDDLLPANTNQALAIIRLKKGINNQYIKFVLSSKIMREYISKCVKGSAQPNLNLQQLNEFEFPYPEKEIQEKIVYVLSNFEKISTDLNIGLPAEIEARQKQYEFYRDILLTYAATGEIISKDKTRQDKTRQDKTRHY